jgi:hypothetical protein
LTEEQKLQFTRPLLIGGNLALLGWVFLSFLSVLVYNLVYGFIYLAFVAAIVYLILRRLGCSSCYMCKSCTSGFGRLAGVFFGKGFVKKESVGNRVAAVGFVYFLLFPLPAAVLVLSLLRVFSPVGVLVLALLLAVSVYSLSTWFKPSAKR